MDALSSCSPQANSQPAPPMAHAPKPTGVMNKSELPSCFVFMRLAVFVFMMSFCFFFLCEASLFHCLLPSAAEGFDQGHGGHELLPPELHRGGLDVQHCVFCRCNFQVRDQAVTVAIVGDLELLAGGG